MIYKKLKIPLYLQHLHIIISKNVEEEIKQINKKWEISIDKYDFSGYSETYNNHHLILINKINLKTEIDIIEVVCHESFHVTNFVFKIIGMIPDVSNDEAQAYLLGWLVQETMKIVKKNGTV